jgi:hypothetical protein
MSLSLVEWSERYGMLAAIALFFVVLDAGDWLNLARKRCEGRTRVDCRDTRRYAYGTLVVAVFFLLAFALDLVRQPAWPTAPATTSDWIALFALVLPPVALLPRLVVAAWRLRAVRRSPLYRVHILHGE